MPATVYSAMACEQDHVDRKLPFPKAESELKPEGDIEYPLSYLDVGRHWFMVPRHLFC